MTTSATRTRLNLIASHDYGPVEIPATIVAGANLAAGTVLGRITSSGKLTAYAEGASDGSQTPVAVLLEDAPAASADVVRVVGFAGVYREANVVGLTAEGKLLAEARGLYFV